MSGGDEAVSATAPRYARAFKIHLAGGVVFVLLAGWRIVSHFLTPVDLFVHRTYLLDAALSFTAFGGLFYGFSLVLLRFCPLPGGWAVAYAVASLVLLLVAFSSLASYVEVGVMRRVVVTETYTDLGTILAWVRTIKWIAACGFAVVQTLFLRFAWPRQRVKD